MPTLERLERSTKRRGIEQPHPVPDELRHDVHEDLIDEPNPEALINNVAPSTSTSRPPAAVSAVATPSLTSTERKL
jgi:hypothetical protein